MEKITNGHPLTQSPDFIKENIETLKKLFPSIVKEDKIDFEELKALLVDDLESDDEYYRFTWAGKSMARREATKPSTGTLRPCIKESKNWDSTQNIFIEGDNLEVLKLLQKSYANKIKMIYIDPPYNTGNDFVYKDDYADNLGSYLAVSGQIDEVGRKKSTNTESDGRYHSNWLNMIYPRLKIARNLLKDDGVIYISIDDNEVINLKKTCDEIFGEENFISLLIWKSKSGGANDSKFIAIDHEYILLYCKDINICEIMSDNDAIVSTSYNKIDEIGKKYSLERLDKQSIRYSPSLDYTILDRDGNEYRPQHKDPNVPNATWRWSKDTVKERFDELVFKDGCVYTKNYEKDGSIPRSLMIDERFGRTRTGKTDFTKLFDVAYFSAPKPINLIKYLANISIDSNSIVLDFFAGSCTTAHSIFQLNSEDNGNRKFICVQLPELTEETSDAFKAGYKNIADIGKERIRKAGEKILNEKREELTKLKAKVEGTILQDDIKQQIDELKKTIETLDVGFKVFKLDSSNINTWDGDPEKLEQNLFSAASNIKENRTENDILYEILLKYGLDLAQPIEQRVIAGKTVSQIGGGVLFICLANDIIADVADGIGKWKEELQPATCKVIFKDSGFTDVEKTNSMQILKRYGIEEVNTI